jgi:O-succinylbenzoic acid--CoA ligase
VSTLSVLDAARAQPAATALVVGQREIAFRELGERVRERVRDLAPCADGPPGGSSHTQLVAFAATESLATLELIYALLELGQPFLPLHARLTSEETAQLLAQLPVQWQVEPNEHGGCRVSERTPRPLGARALDWFQSTHQLAALPTSGSSGTPRVVALSRRAFLASAAASAAHLGWHSDDRWLLCLPLAHIGGLSVLTRCLLARRPVVLGEPACASAALDQRLARAIVEGRPRLLSLVPTQLSALLQFEPRFELPAYVRVILTGGAAASESVLRAAEARGWPVLTSYGMTEACSQIATQRLGSLPNAERGAGWPLPGVEVRICEGAIQVRGPTLFSGYLLGPSEPFDPEGWFTTGDLGHVDAGGQLQVSGRSDQMIISGGENVAPAEVEAALESCQGVLEACVFAVPDPHWGQLVAAGIRLQPGDAEHWLESVRRELEQRLAAFKRPRQYALTQAFSYGPTGKLDRRATALVLREQLRPAPRGS